MKYSIGDRLIFTGNKGGVFQVVKTVELRSGKQDVTIRCMSEGTDWVYENTYVYGDSTVRSNFYKQNLIGFRGL